MRILFCNKYNYPFSGTEAYLFELMEMMRSHGHEVALFSMVNERGEPTRYDRHFVERIDFKATTGPLGKAQLAAHAIYSTEARQKIRAMIHDFRPDVAHVRNIYHHLSPSILWELRAQGVPVVYHLNDFKLLCPSYNLVARGEACEACKRGKFWRALRSECYPGLGARTTLVAEAYVHRWLGTYRTCVDRFLAPSQFVREKFVEHGWDGSKFEVLPHFQKAGLENENLADGPVVYCGRLSAEKGVDDLLCAIAQVPGARLVIAGEGPQRRELQELAVQLGLRNVEFVGQIGPAERDALIARSRFTVLPSHAYETLGKTILESYAQSRAVVTTDLGSRREFVHHGETGLLYRCGDVNELAQAIALLVANPDIAQEMGRAGRDLVRTKHKPEEHYEKLVGLYGEVIRNKGGQKRCTAIWLKRKQFISSVPAARESMNGWIRPGDRLRIAFIGGRGVISKYSGIETYYEEVGRRLAARGHELTVYCRNHFTPSQKEYEGMRLVRLPTIRTKHLETFVHTLLSTAHAVTRDYDVVHYHTLGPALFSFIPRMFRAKTVVTVQGLDWQRKKWGRVASAVLQLGERASVRFPNETIVVSQTLQRRYLALHGKQTRYVPNGGMLRERSEARKILEWGLRPGEYVLFLGRFSPEKGCHLLVDAFERIETDTTLVMAGASSYCDDYSQELRKHANNRIRMLEWASGETLDELLTNAMIFVLPSDMEGLSLALLDAMAAGLCVLASDVPENREAVGGAGFLFRCGDVKDLAERLRFLIANPAAREAAGKAAAKRVREQYQWQEISETIERAYFELCGQGAMEALPKKPNLRHEIADGETQRRAG